MNQLHSQSAKAYLQKNREAIRYIVFVAVFSALAYAVTFIFHIKVSFLTFDAKDAVITVAAFLLGPLGGTLISLIVALIEMVSIGGTGFWGFLMDFVSTASFAVTASVIYHYVRSARGALLSVGAASVASVSVMMLFNLFITPIYMGVDRATVVTMIPTLLLPFNVAKALLNTSITMLLYKPISLTLRRMQLLPSLTSREAQKPQDSTSASKMQFGFATLWIVLIALLAAAVSVFMFVKLHAKIG